jgi:hypothetical protein
LAERAIEPAADSNSAGTPQGASMRATLKIQADLLGAIHKDLSRPHPVAAERVGFVACRLAELAHGGLVVLAETYLPVADEHYEDDPSVGAMMNSSAIRTALQYSFNCRTAMFHVHRHDHCGHPAFSLVDLRYARRFVPDFWKVQPTLTHGALVLSHDRIHGVWWDSHSREPRPFREYVTIGFPTTIQEEAPHE